VERLDARCFDGGTRTNLQAELERPFTHAWVADVPAVASESSVAGFLLTWHVADELHVLNVATDPAFRRRGIGHALMMQALSFARDNTIRLILLEVRRSNRAAILLYRRLGFTILDVRKSYYSDNGEDALEMGLVLDPETGDIVPGRDEVRLEEDYNR
jgi:ribosomal-protein-alanine N-acetyltransferase